jgi:signal transduction histidine kinase
LAAATLWLAGWTDLYQDRVLWTVAALTALGSSLIAALVVLAFHVRRLAVGPERRALGLILAGGIVGVVGSLTDFLPRGESRVTEVGPVAVLTFLLIVSAVVLRHRFLDIDRFVARAVSLIAGATAAALVYLAVLRFIDPSMRFVTLFLTSAVVLAVVVPISRSLMIRARSWLAPVDPVSDALQRVSGRLASARSSQEVTETVQEALSRLPVSVEVCYRAREQAVFRRVFGEDSDSIDPLPVPEDNVVPVLLERERTPLTRHFLETEQSESVTRGPLAETVLKRMLDAGQQLLVPIFEEQRLRGWIAVGGEGSARYSTAEVATAFLAVGNQALASLERIEALEAARRREALAAVGELAAGLAHEVRNPVAAIRGAAQAMGPQATAVQREEMLGVIEEESARLGRVVGEFLDYARPTSPRRESIDPAALFAQCLRGQELAGRRIEGKVTLVEPAPRVAGDPDQLRRALDNLLQNSWEAAGDRVRVELELTAIEGGRVSLRFGDNGPGIPTGEIARLFQPFHTTKDGGTGLGLALVHRIVESHGGEIRVDSRAGAGTTFTIVLPAGDDVRGTEERS